MLGPFDTLKSGSDMLHREWSNFVMGRRLVDVINEGCRTGHYAYRTEETYLYWIKRYISFNGNRPPRELRAVEIQQFLSNLATEFLCVVTCPQHRTYLSEKKARVLE